MVREHLHSPADAVFPGFSNDLSACPQVCLPRQASAWTTCGVSLHSAHEFREGLGSRLPSPEHQGDPVLDRNSFAPCPAALGRGSAHHAYSRPATSDWCSNIYLQPYYSAYSSKWLRWPLTLATRVFTDLLRHLAKCWKTAILQNNTNSDRSNTNCSLKQ